MLLGSGCQPPVNPCACPPATAIPGASGLNCSTQTTANFVIPVSGANVVVGVLDTSWMVVGEQVVIGQNLTANTGPAHFTVVSVLAQNSVTLQFDNETGDIAAGNTISLGANVSPSGVPGVNGQNGYTTTASNFILPSPGYPVTIAVLNTAMFVVGQNVIVGQNQPNGPVANFIVEAINSATSLSLIAQGYVNDSVPGTTMLSGSTVTSAGSAGVSSYTKTTSQITLPTANQTILVNVLNNQWMAVGQTVVVGSSGAGGGATFSVEAIPANTTTEVYLTWLNYPNDLVTGSKLPVGSIVTPSGQLATTNPGILQVVIGGSTAAVENSGNLASSSSAPAYNATGVTSGFSTSITPESGASTIFFRAVINFYAPAGTIFYAGVYTATGSASPIACAASESSATANEIGQLVFEGSVPSTGAAMTFYLMIGAATSGNVYMNGNSSGAQLFGGIPKSTLTLTEYLP